MRTMLEYIEEATNLLGAVWGEAKAGEVRDYLKKYLSHWSIDEQEDLLILCATLASYEAQAVNDVLWVAQRSGRERQDAARKTSRNLSQFTIRQRDKRETEYRRSVIERHFGAALRGEASPGGSADQDDA